MVFSACSSRHSLAVILLLLATSGAWAGALNRPAAVGTRDIGLGGDPDGLKLQDNLAARTQLTDTWADATVELVRPHFTYTTVCGEKVSSATTVAPMPYLQYGQPLNDWLAFGVGVQTTFGLGSKFNNNPQQLGYDTETMIATVSTVPSLAAKVTDHLSLGTGLILGVAQFLYKAPFDINRHPLPIYTDNTAYGLGLGLGFGATYDFDNGVICGLNWMSEVKAHLDGRSTIWLGPFGVRDDFDSAFTFPARLDAAVAWKVSDRLQLTANWYFVNYSETPNDMTLKFKDLGINKTNTLNWKDNYSVNFGASCKVTDRWTIRGGGGYMTQSIPDDKVNTLTVDTPGLDITAGTSYKFTDSFTLDGSITHGWGKNDVDMGFRGREKYTAAITTFAVAGNLNF